MNDCSIILPAFNEEAFLPESLKALHAALKADGVIAQIIVADNDSTDKTASLAKELGAEVIHEPIRQIARARNAGAAQASSELLIFIDSDTLVQPGLIIQALQQLKSGSVVAGGASMELDRGSPSSLKAVRAWNQIGAKLKLAAGSFFFCRRDAFEACRGFPEGVYASEEIWLMKRLKAWGRKNNMGVSILSSPAVITSGRKFEWFPPWAILLQLGLFALFPFLCRFRWCCFLWYFRPKNSV